MRETVATMDRSLHDPDPYIEADLDFHLALAEAAIQAASRLSPDAAETHLARAWNLYWGYLDYDGALAELEVARRTLPNDPQILFLTGLIQRRQGHWEESTRTFERAANLKGTLRRFLRTLIKDQRHAVAGRQ